MRKIVTDILAQFAVGTERRQIKMPPAPKPNELVPLRFMNKTSSTKRALDKINKCEIDSLLNESLQNLSDDFTPNYYGVYCSTRALDIEFSELNFIGFRLLEKRALIKINEKG